MNNKYLSVVAYANGLTIWAYNDMSLSVDDVEKVGFFDGVKELMHVGDIMYLVCKDTVKHMWVKTVNPVSLEDMGE